PIDSARPTGCRARPGINTHSNHSENRVAAGGTPGDSAGDQRLYCLVERFIIGIRHHHGRTHENVWTACRDELRLHRDRAADGRNLFFTWTADRAVIPAA